MLLCLSQSHSLGILEYGFRILIICWTKRTEDRSVPMMIYYHACLSIRNISWYQLFYLQILCILWVKEDVFSTVSSFFFFSARNDMVTENFSVRKSCQLQPTVNAFLMKSLIPPMHWDSGEPFSFCVRFPRGMCLLQQPQLLSEVAATHPSVLAFVDSLSSSGCPRTLTVSLAWVSLPLCDPWNSKPKKGLSRESQG